MDVHYSVPCGMSISSSIGQLATTRSRSSPNFVDKTDVIQRMLHETLAHSITR